MIMGTYGQNRFYITFDNVALADIFELDLKALNPEALGFEYERDGDYFDLFSSEQDKIVWSRDTAGEQIEYWLGTNLHLSKTLLDKCAKVVMYRYATEWYWDNVDCEKLISWAGLNANNVPDDLDLDEMLGDTLPDRDWET